MLSLIMLLEVLPRTQATTQSCLSTQAGQSNVCTECDTGYALLLFSPYVTVCAAYDTTDNTCTIDSDNYPTEYTYQNDNSIAYTYYSGDSVATPYCFNCEEYYKRTVSGSTVSLCSVCTQQDLSSNFFENSVYSMSQGCSSCTSTSYPQLNVTYLSQASLYMRECSAKQATTACTVTQTYITKKSACVECSSLYPNCAACNSTQCLLCPKGYYLHKGLVDYQQGGKAVDSCQFGVCPFGYCRNEYLNTCVKQITLMETCHQCTTDATGATQTCQVCRAGYQFNETTGLCEALSGIQDITFFVNSTAPALLADYTYDRTVTTLGTNVTTPFLFIQEALDAAISYQEQYLNASLNVTIYLGSGDHFLFHCDGSEDYSGVSATLVAYCTEFGNSLQQRYSLFDNYTVTIKPLYCSLRNLLLMQNSTDFNYTCLATDTLKPVIYVNHANTYFNISGAFTVENVKFSGLNAMAVPTDSSYDLTRYPAVFCKVTTEPNGYEAIFKLVKYDNTNSNSFDYTCSDKWYTAPQRLDMTKMDRKCTANSNKKFDLAVESTLKCPGDPGDPGFFTQNGNKAYSQRRFALFNMYSFPSNMSTYKLPPLLTLNKVDFEYFLGGYEALIYVENANLQKIEQSFTFETDNDGTVTQTRPHYNFYGADKGVRIRVMSSSFKNSRFCKGMIVYRKPLLMVESKSLTNYTNIYSFTGNSEKTAYIAITWSNFIQLNLFNNVTALASYGGKSPNRTLYATDQLEALTYHAFMHRGIVLNIEDFGGSVEVTLSQFTRNIFYLSEAVVYPRKPADQVSIEQFRTSTSPSEYKVSTCDPDSRTDRNLFTHGISMDTEMDALFDKFERLSVIYISRNRKLMYFKDNRFYRNTGTFGGAIAINSPNFSNSQRPFVVIDSCNFLQNQGFFGGNGLYMRNTIKKSDQGQICAGGYIINSNFTQNIGLKAHNGGAIAALCEYIDDPLHDDYYSTSSTSSIWIAVDSVQELYEQLDSVLEGASTIAVLSFRFNIENTQFIENYSGQKGSAVYLKQISKIRIANSNFQSNGPTISNFEYQYSAQTVYMSNRPMSYYDPNLACLDEFQYMNDCAPSSGLVVDFPRTNGAVYVQHCTELFCTNDNENQIVYITGCDFIGNDAGPHIKSDYGDNAASLYINGGLSTTISRTRFRDHKGSHDYYTTNVAPIYGKFYPSQYYTYANAPIIKVMLSPIAGVETFLKYNLSISNSNFTNNKHIQLLGGKQYYGSLLHYETTYTNGSKFFPSVNIANTAFRDNKFLGNQTSLVYIHQAYINFTNNTVTGNGFLSNNITRKSASASIKADGYTFYLSQHYGFLRMINTEQFSATTANLIRDNKFSFNFAQQGAAIYMYLQGQFVSLDNNLYRYNFAQTGPALSVQTSDTQRSTIQVNNDYVDAQFGQSYGAFAFQPLLQNLLSVQMTNVSFRNCFSQEGSSIYGSNLAAVIVRNSTFWDTNFALSSNKANLITSAFAPQSWQLLELVDARILSPLSDGIVRNTGAVSLNGGLNTQSILFANYQFLRRSNYTYLQYSEFINCSFENMSSTQASAISIQGSLQVRISNSQQGLKLFRNLKHKSFGAIKVDSNSTLVLENATFAGCQAQEKGGALYIGSASSVSAQNCTFRNSDARDRGASAFVTDQSRFNCSQCSFSNNTAKQSSAIYATTNDLLPLSIMLNNSMFTNNTQDTTLVTLSSTNALIENTKFIDNTALYTTHGFQLMSSNLIANNISVTNTLTQFLRTGSPNVDVGFFSLSSRSNLTLNKSTSIINTRAAQASVIMATGFSNIQIDGGTLIQGCQSTSGGSTIELQMATNSVIRSTVFMGNSETDLLLDRSSLILVNVTMNLTKSNSIYALQSNLSIANSTFLNGIDQLANGKGIYCNCHILNISSSTFQNLTALQGGALYLTSSSEFSTFTIRNSSFKDNQAMQGGAIKLQDAYQLTIANNSFQGNQAKIIKPVNQQSMRLMQKGQGGAINMDCNNIPMKLVQNCDVKIIEVNNFFDNYAETDGGAMIYTSNPFYSDRKNNLQRNYAEVYGSDLASYPKQLMVVFRNNNDDTNPVDNDADAYGRLLQDTGSSQAFPTVVPGVPFSFELYILDQQGEVYLSDSSSVAKLIANCTGCDLTGNKITANQGMFNFSDVVLKVQPGSNVSLSLSTSGIETYGNEMPKISQAISINISTRSCALGEEQTSDNSCLKCDSKSFLFIAPNRQTNCKSCPNEAICFGKNQVSPAKGYWRWSNDSESFIACQNKDACLAGDINHPTGMCAEGYTGILCATCENGYRRTGPFECNECPTMAPNFFYLLILLLIGITISLVLVRANLNVDDKSSPAYSVYLKIIISHFQILGIIMYIEYGWPKELQKLQDGYAYFSGISQEIFSYDCFLQNSGYSMQEDTHKFFQIKLIFFVFLPLIIVGVVALFWGAIGMLRKNFYDLKVKTISTSLVVFFIIHPSISRIYFQTFNCLEIDGEQRLREDLSTLCYEGRHMIEVVVLAVPAIIVWTFGVPIVILAILIKNKKTIAQMHQQSQLSKTDQHAVKELRMKYGFLITGYKTRIFYWEIVVIARKILLVMLTVFLTVVSADTQVLAGLLCLILSMILHVKFEPYAASRLNRMEHYSLQVTSLTIYAGTFYITGGKNSYMQGDGVKWFFFFLIVVPNCAFFLHWVNQMRIEILKMALNKGKRLFKLLSCGLIDAEEFHKRHILYGENDMELENGMDRTQKYTHAQNRTAETNFNQAQTPGQGIDANDFDDITQRKRSVIQRRPLKVGVSGMYQGNREDTPQSSSDSDFKKSLDFEKQGDPNFDTDKQSSGGPHSKGKNPLKLNLDGIKLGFPANIARRIPDQDDVLVLDDIVTRLDGTTLNSRVHTPGNASQNGRYTNRDGQGASYRKIYPEQILTQRGFREDGPNLTNVSAEGGYHTAVSDRSRAGMLQRGHKQQQQSDREEGRRSPMFRQDYSREEKSSSDSDSSEQRNGVEEEVDDGVESKHNITQSDVGRDGRDSQMIQLSAGKVPEAIGRKNAYRNSDEVDEGQIYLEYPTNPQSMRKGKSSHRKGPHRIENKQSGSETPESYSSDQDQDFDFKQDYGEEIGNLEEEKMENSDGTDGLRELIGDINKLPRGSVDTYQSRERNNFMQQTFTLKEQLRDVNRQAQAEQVNSDAFELTIHKRKANPGSDSPKNSSIRDIQDSSSGGANQINPDQQAAVDKADDRLQDDAPKPQRRLRKTKVFI